jgi:hypothetical protein
MVSNGKYAIRLVRAFSEMVTQQIAIIQTDTFGVLNIHRLLSAETIPQWLL